MRSKSGVGIVAAAVVAAAAVCLPAPANADTGTTRYLVEYSASDAAQAKASIKAVGAKIVTDLGKHNAAAVLVANSKIEVLRASRGITWIEPDVERYPLSQSVPYGITLTQADQIKAPNPGNKKVCIIDSGLYTGHEDIPKNVTGDSDPGGAGPWNVDGLGHGTHVAGTIAAVNNDLGVIGVNPGVNLHIVRVFGDNGDWAYSSTLVAALDKCVAAGSNVVSMSLGGSRASYIEQKAFDSANKKGLLSVAAAGNSGNTSTSYPAGYASVMSVAAVDSANAHASFSQRNRDVEISAPGVAVKSTVPFVSTSTVTVNGTTYTGTNVEGSASTAGITGPLVDGGICDSSGTWTGMVVLCKRGTNTFADKVAKVKAGGGTAAVIFNSDSTSLSATLNGTSTIPAIALNGTDGNTLLALAPGAPSATVVNQVTRPASGYESWDGTSMATPHVSGIAALLWSCAPTKTNTDIRNAIDQSAKDLGSLGRDTSYGYGLIQAKAALVKLNGGTC